MNLLSSLLISPSNRSDFHTIDELGYTFTAGDTYPTVEGIPVLVSKGNSLFDVDSIRLQRPTTQNRAYTDKRKLKNFVRASILPKLNIDWTLEKRYASLASQVKGGRVLIVGSGSKIDFYKTVFNEASLVVTSDIHLQFKPDIVFDVHEIPFKDNTFDLVLAGQVMEHTIRPWLAAQELERVVKRGGILQIEVPFAFPNHGAPYDFFRFTFTGMRSLFRKCKLVDFCATEGSFASAAVANGQALIDVTNTRLLRYVLLVFGRFIFFWLKYLDLLKSGKKATHITNAKGLAFTFSKDCVERSDAECLLEFRSLI